ncbi:serine--tRNA ligase [Candidatus Kaiserbacteria bacterium RIFCSPLOWO2_02_FULL_54_13]|uniref:Serine--tRNA ligase n=1 Tax=Candidatus Kaiserbacteria bacterium RIFCSPHIGHO2_02_FULL_54_22 TaxID=1798495 RepID=A0A1F6DN53_9BACT|nr:MAG: serine--tRNA ligase [Candidatus Kaiserbacteria bacterium RIFCSPHIGHO2_02_FULL_54_22]OGG82536.1 MAG: serine--tRNA ligase [Candidatus Kaiserbacteria bacterium RIFCSPLOWO2_02_FULL_54_13]OGG90557.1 MAG: serine--tRNA ligase [Candidatus Kaiserbacteria bacterium RIFCSPLOWO2_12_FULL_54_10]
MLDIHFIRENVELVKAGAAKKHIEVDLDRLIKVDDERKLLRQELDAKKAEQNRRSNEIQITKDKEREKIIEQMQQLKAGMAEEEERLKKVMEEWQKLMLTVPNIPDMSVPDGNSDADNLETKKWGEQTKFDFTPKGHVELMTVLDLVDFERGAKVAGFRGYFLKGDAALLSYALWQFISNYFVKKGAKGDKWIPMIVPSLARRESFMGTGYVPQSEEDLYKTQDGEYLAGTAEVATMGYHMNEVLDAKQFPLKYFSFSPCFRREAGAHGKDTKGLVRVHEFFKFEQVVLCEASHEASVKYHEELTANAEEMLQLLKIPYRVVINCSGDLGLGQVKKYDIECWMPSEGKYRETHSSSYFHDFQTRRLNIRYRDERGEMKFAHSLNNTALATPRLLAVLIENYQQEGGTIAVPEALAHYVGKKVIGPAG